MHASRPSRVSTCTSEDTTPTSSEVNTPAGRGVDEFEPETRPAWLRSDSSGCSRVSGGDKIVLARVVPPPPPRKLPPGNRTTDLDQRQRSRTSTLGVFLRRGRRRLMQGWVTVGRAWVNTLRDRDRNERRD
ncbi:hypothetical protein B0H14DRAFT_2600023 [Mycena olivaceomarginata]|nr:hypothetical protein B0H14DRAFT_2600023 [Mycena olivaceomarginata]